VVETESKERQRDDVTPAAFGNAAHKWLAERLTPVDGTTPAPDVTEVITSEEEKRVLSAALAFQAELFEAGFAGITWPVEYGGQGLSLDHQVAFDEAAGEFHLPTSGVFTIGHGMCGPTLLAHGSQAQRERYIRPMLSGTELWCQLFSEPNAGSDLASLTTKATPAGDGWTLHGQKLWTSGAHYCDFGIVLVRTDSSAQRSRGLTMLVLDLHAPGVTIRPIRQLTGGARFNEIFLDGAAVVHEDVIGVIDDGWRVATTTLMNERVAIGASARRHELVNPLVRMAADAGLTSTGTVRDELARVWIDETILGYVGLRIREAILRGHEPGPEGSIAKLANARVSKRAASLGTKLLGAGATAWKEGDESADTAVSRLLLATGSSLAGGTDEIQKNVIGERVLGLPREPAGGR
jgi:alkylation response protein AidB-like acyl-CoA dehydrogenase